LINANGKPLLDEFRSKTYNNTTPVGVASTLNATISKIGL
jgi:hypothetical protein